MILRRRRRRRVKVMKKASIYARIERIESRRGWAHRRGLNEATARNRRPRGRGIIQSSVERIGLTRGKAGGRGGIAYMIGG